MPAPRFIALLLVAATTSGLLLGAGAPAQAAENRPVARVMQSSTQVLSAKALLAGAENPSDYKKYGGCKIVTKRLACWAKPWVDKHVGYTPLRITPRLIVPASIIKRALPGTLRMQVTASFAKLKGRVYLTYGGDYATWKHGSVTGTAPRTLGSADLTKADTYDGKVLPLLDFGLAKGTRATFKQVRVTYTYEAVAS